MCAEDVRLWPVLLDHTFQLCTSRSTYYGWIEKTLFLSFKSVVDSKEYVFWFSSLALSESWWRQNMPNIDFNIIGGALRAVWHLFFLFKKFHNEINACQWFSTLFVPWNELVSLLVVSQIAQKISVRQRFFLILWISNEISPWRDFCILKCPEILAFTRLRTTLVTLGLATTSESTAGSLCSMTSYSQTRISWVY